MSDRVRFLRSEMKELCMHITNVDCAFEKSASFGVVHAMLHQLLHVAVITVIRICGSITILENEIFTLRLSKFYCEDTPRGCMNPIVADA